MNTMARTNDATPDQPDTYLPAMPTPSTEPGRIERLLRRLLRRRGGLRPVLRRR